VLIVFLGEAFLTVEPLGDVLRGDTLRGETPPPPLVVIPVEATAGFLMGGATRAEDCVGVGFAAGAGFGTGVDCVLFRPMVELSILTIELGGSNTGLIFRLRDGFDGLDA